MFEKLNSIENVKFEILDNKLVIHNSNNYNANIVISDVVSTEIISASDSEEGFLIRYKLNDFFIVTSDDFIFNTQNYGSYKVENLPEIISLLDIVESVKAYINNPEPNNNIDNTVALYLFAKTLLDNAEHNNFDIIKLREKVNQAALSTDSIDDLTIYN